MAVPLVVSGTYRNASLTHAARHVCSPGSHQVPFRFRWSDPTRYPLKSSCDSSLLSLGRWAPPTLVHAARGAPQLGMAVAARGAARELGDLRVAQLAEHLLRWSCGGGHSAGGVEWKLVEKDR